MVFEDRQLSWSELWRKTLPAANLLTEKLDDENQQVVGLLLPNSIEFVITYLAIVHSGHIAMPLDPAYKPLEIQAIISQMEPRLLIGLGPDSENYDIGASDFLDVDALLSHEKNEEKQFLRLPADQQIASMIFTSGTTGLPKAVPNTHANHLWNIKTCSEVWDWTASDTLLITVPLSHMLGVVMGISGSLYHSNTLYIHKWFDPHETLEALASGKISFFTHAASAYVRLVQVSDKSYDLSKVRLCVSGAAPLPPAVWQEFKDRFGIEIRETYGSSETGRIAANRLNEPIVHGSPGRALPDVAVKLSSQGEIVVRSPGVFPGYYRNPEATASSLTADDYWRTGDIGEIKDGNIFLKGRIQERIRRFGYTVSPRDVEWAMHQHPAVKDIYVMGRQQPGEPSDELIYFVVGQLSQEEIRDFAKRNLLFAWRPDKIIHVDELPKTRSGKTRIGELEKVLQDGGDGTD